MHPLLDGTYLKVGHTESVSFRDDKEIALVAMAFLGSSLYFASKRLQDDDEVVAVAMQNDPRAHKYASERIQVQLDFYKDTPQKQFIQGLLKQWAESGEWKTIAWGPDSPLSKVEKILQLHGIQGGLTKDLFAFEEIRDRLYRFADHRFATRYTNKDLLRMLGEELERLVFTHPDVVSLLQKNREALFQAFAHGLDRKTLALVTSTTLLQRPKWFDRKRSIRAQGELLRILSKMLEQRKDISLKLLESDAQVIIVPKDETLYGYCKERIGSWNCPVYRPEVGGMHDLVTGLTLVTEENLTGLPSKTGRGAAAGSSTVVHELAHLIHNMALPSSMDQKFKKIYTSKVERIEAKFADKRQGDWKYSNGAYAASNHFEYFAEFVRFYFEANGIEDSGSLLVGRSTFDRLGSEDKQMLALCREIFGNETTIHYTKPRFD